MFANIILKPTYSQQHTKTQRQPHNDHTTRYIWVGPLRSVPVTQLFSCTQAFVECGSFYTLSTAQPFSKRSHSCILYKCFFPNRTCIIHAQCHTIHTHTQTFSSMPHAHQAHKFGQALKPPPKWILHSLERCRFYNWHTPQILEAFLATCVCLNKVLHYCDNLCVYDDQNLSRTQSKRERARSSEKPA